MSHIPKKAHWPPFYIYLQTACIALAAWYFTHGRYQDDAYISLKYAVNLLAGNGLTWNPGEVVEGYSNFLFLILTAAHGWLGMDLVRATNLLNFIGYAGLLFIIHGYTQKLYRQQFAATSFAYAHRINRALCFALVASSIIVLAWCFGGLEALFYTTLLTAAVCMVLLWLQQGTSNQQALLAGILFALAAMTRVEAVMVGGISGLFLGLVWLTNRSGKVRFSALLLLAAGFMLVYAPYTLWRVQYFGEFLPNTYYAKLYGMPPGLLFTQGLFYFLQFVLVPPMPILAAAALLYFCGRKQVLNAPIRYLTLLVTAYCFYIIKSGGDHMYYFRFFVPVIPLCALLIYHINGLIIPRDEKRFRDICGAFIILLVLQFGIVRPDEHASAGAASGMAVADYVKEHWPEGTTIALNPVGALPYFVPGHRYVDMLGLLSPTIAHRSFLQADAETVAQVRGKGVGHQKGDGAYVLSQKPDYIIFGNAAWGSRDPVFLSDIELAASQEFQQQYVLQEIDIDPPEKLLPALRQMAEEKQKNQPGPVLNAEGKLRFIYYQLHQSIE